MHPLLSSLHRARVRAATLLRSTVNDLRSIRRDRGSRRSFVVSALAPPAVLLGLLVGGAALEPPAEGPRADSADAGFADAGPTDSLARKAAFLDARLAAADNRAIGLSLDLADSTLVIETGGVPLRRCRVLEARVGRAADRVLDVAGPTPALFTLQAARATIPRAPVRVVEAPADSAQAAARPPQEVPDETREAAAVLRFERGLVVYLRPAEASLGSHVFNGGFWASERLASTVRTLGAATSEDLHRDAWIEVTLSLEDVKAVYRALPDGAALALRLP